jgi:hypothetical protein
VRGAKRVLDLCSYFEVRVGTPKPDVGEAHAGGELEPDLAESPWSRHRIKQSP